MTAPTMPAVAETLSAAKTYGRAVGKRSCQSTRQPPGAQEVVDVRHRGVVDHERPLPVLAHPEPAVALPETPERREHEDEEHHAPGRVSQPERASLPRALGCDRRHGRCLPHRRSAAYCERMSAFRASDEDREFVAESLGGDLLAGRLTVEEYEERVARVYRSTTYAELDQIVADLPWEPSHVPVPRRRPLFGNRPISVRISSP